MKASIIFFIAIFVFPIFSYGETIINKKSPDTFYSMDTNRTESGDPIRELIITMDDIKSFRLISNGTFPGEPYMFFGEIEFINIKTDDLLYGIGTHATVYFLLDDKLLFDPPIRIYAPGASMSSNDLQMLFSRSADKFLLFEYYRDYSNDSWLTEEEREEILKEHEEISKMRKKQLDVFIKYLSDAGKLIVGDVTGLESVIPPESDAISIYPNPTAGELRMENGEWRIENVEVFDICGIKQLSIFNFQFSTQIDISHLPAGIYFVRITTEKGVVTKKVVKR